MRIILKFFLLISIIISATACYRMPTDEDYCLIPSTNNPDFTRERESATPGIGY